MADFDAEILATSSNLTPLEGAQEADGQSLVNIGGSTRPPIADLGFDTGMQKS